MEIVIKIACKYLRNLSIYDIFFYLQQYIIMSTMMIIGIVVAVVLLLIIIAVVVLMSRSGAEPSAPVNTYVPADSAQPAVVPGYPDGAVLRCDATGGIYKIENGATRHFSSMAVYNSWGAPAYATGDCATLSAMPVGPVMEMK
jgi:hypothetical protein